MSIHTHEIEVDEFLDRFFVTLAITFEFTPGEPMVKYLPDGSGYPGSSESIDIIDVIVTQLSGETYDKNRKELVTQGWAECMDDTALDYINSEIDAHASIRDELFDIANSEGDWDG